MLESHANLGWFNLLPLQLRDFIADFLSLFSILIYPDRFFVHSSIYAEFASKLATKVAEFKTGSGFESDVTHGPLIHSKSLKKVVDHVERAKAKGAQVLVGGRVPDDPQCQQGYFFEPTVLSDVYLGDIDQEETFGELFITAYWKRSCTSIIYKQILTDIHVQFRSCCCAVQVRH